MRGWYLCLLLASCGSAPEEEIDYDRIVKQEEEAEWISAPPPGQHVAGELFPSPQESLIIESER